LTGGGVTSYRRGLPTGFVYSGRQFLDSVFITIKAKAANLLGMKHYQTLDAQVKRLRLE
jgi:hypothetical protein